MDDVIWVIIRLLTEVYPVSTLWDEYDRRTDKRKEVDSFSGFAMYCTVVLNSLKEEM